MQFNMASFFWHLGHSSKIFLVLEGFFRSNLEMELTLEMRNVKILGTTDSSTCFWSL